MNPQEGEVGTNHLFCIRSSQMRKVWLTVSTLRPPESKWPWTDQHNFQSHIDEEPPKLIFQYEKADYNKMRELLDVAWQEVFSEPCVIDNIDEQWNMFSKRYYEAEKICVPARRLKTDRKRFAVPLDRNALAKRRKNTVCGKSILKRGTNICWVQEVF